LKLAISNKDATCRLGLHDTAALTPARVQIDRSDCSATRNRCTPSAETAVRFQPFSSYGVGRFACTTPAEATVRFGPFYTGVEALTHVALGPGDVAVRLAQAFANGAQDRVQLCGVLVPALDESVEAGGALALPGSVQRLEPGEQPS